MDGGGERKENIEKMEQVREGEREGGGGQIEREWEKNGRGMGK